MPNSLRQHRVIDPVLTTIIAGFVMPELIGEVILPPVPHDREGGTIQQFGKEAFQAYNTTRAPRSRVARVDYETAEIEFAMKERSVEMATDRRESEESAGMAIQAEKAAAIQCQSIIRLDHERDVAALVTSTGSYAAGNTTSLTSGNRWSAPETSDPVADIEAGKEAVRQKIGVRPNLLVLGAASYKALKNHPKLLDRIKYSQKGILTTELLASIFDVKQVVVGEAITSDAKGVFSDIWGKFASLHYVAPFTTAGLGTPSWGYTLRKKGRPNASKYFDDAVKSDVVQVEDIYATKVLAPGAGYLIQTAVA